MGQTNRNSKIGCATRVESKKVKYPQTLLLKVHYETSLPTVLDRFIQQAVMQVLQRRWGRTFSQHSYGFRPGRSAHQAVAQAQQSPKATACALILIWRNSLVGSITTN